MHACLPHVPLEALASPCSRVENSWYRLDIRMRGRKVHKIIERERRAWSNRPVPMCHSQACERRAISWFCIVLSQHTADYIENEGGLDTRAPSHLALKSGLFFGSVFHKRKQHQACRLAHQITAVLPRATHRDNVQSRISRSDFSTNLCSSSCHSGGFLSSSMV